MGFQVIFSANLAHLVVAELVEGLRKFIHHAVVHHFVLLVALFWDREGPVRPNTEDLLFIGVFIEDVVEGAKVFHAVIVELARPNAALTLITVLTVHIVDDFEQNDSLR